MFCGNCGNELDATSGFCPYCGAPINNRGTDVNNSGYSQYSQYSQVSSGNAKTMAVLSYITWIGFIVALVSSEKDDPYVKFHINQALVLNLASIICAAIPLVGWLADIAILVFWIMGLISAAEGSQKEVPILGQIKLIQ